MKNLDLSGMTTLRRTRFTEILILENALDESGFAGWIFCPGMLFNALDKWWGEQGKRDQPHEGLDLCLYRDRQDRILHLDVKTKIPAMHDGLVVAIFDDFLGKSLILEHSLPHGDNRRFCTIYGHTDPSHGLSVGKIVKQGDIIATLAETSKPESGIYPHLHMSLGRTTRPLSCDKLGWETIGAPNILTLTDPIDVIDGPYQTLEGGSHPCRNL